MTLAAALTSAIIQDPVVVVELCAVVLSFCYLCRAVYPGRESTPALGAPLPLKVYSARQHSFYSWFEVGNLIPLTKRSLFGQRVLR